jgi:3-dehydroquinate synthase
MRSLEIALADGRAYPVHIGAGLLDEPELWAAHLPDALVVVVSNDVVAPLYLDRVLRALRGREVLTRVLPDGEAQKTFDQWRELMAFLARHEARRDTCLVALGGGVVGDLVGFAAATWMRGIRFVQAPTTLLAQVDASVGGKTAINLPEGKNLVGAFHQPAAVLADIGTLSTLAPREYRAGLAEVVKYGAIRDAGFIDLLEEQRDALLARDPECLEEVVARSVACKAAVVAADEREQGVRAILNFGHSFGHALETHTAYTRFLHGEAVAIGMAVAARLSEARGLCPPGFADRLRRLLQALGLEVTIPRDISAADLLGHMRLDKKNLTGQRRLVLLRGPGDAFVDHGSSDEEIRDALEASR